MNKHPPRDVTQLQHGWRGGDPAALNRSILLIHDELHRPAQHYMLRARVGHTLPSTAVVNEASLRLVDAHQIPWQNCAHSLATTANLMRRTQIDFARSRGYGKRAGSVVKVEFKDTRVPSHRRRAHVIALGDALTGLEAFDEREAQGVELRFSKGKTGEETAEAMGVSSDPVLRDWKSVKLRQWREIRCGKRYEP